jgi:hypothetical protein
MALSVLKTSTLVAASVQVRTYGNVDVKDVQGVQLKSQFWIRRQRGIDVKNK